MCVRERAREREEERERTHEKERECVNGHECTHVIYACSVRAYMRHIHTHTRMRMYIFKSAHPHTRVHMYTCTLPEILSFLGQKIWKFFDSADTENRQLRATNIFTPLFPKKIWCCKFVVWYCTLSVFLLLNNEFVTPDFCWK